MTEYRKKSDGTIVQSVGALRAANPMVSFQAIPDADDLTVLGYDEIQPTTMPTGSLYKKPERDGVEESGGNWVEKWKLTDLDTATVESEAATSARDHRDTLLKETDWWAGADLTMKSARTAYRQELRDLPTASGWPHTHTLPTKPA